jgi:hypothetical protein
MSQTQVAPFRGVEAYVYAPAYKPKHIRYYPFMVLTRCFSGVEGRLFHGQGRKATPLRPWRAER